jgi:hypothetical protein
MSSAYLANELDKLNVAEGPPSNHAFEKAFVDYQTMRGPQAKASIKEAQFLYWTGSLATPFAAFLQGHVIRKISTEAMLVGFAQGATGAVPLKRVSLPSRRGTIPWNHEIALKPEARSAISTADCGNTLSFCREYGAGTFAGNRYWSGFAVLPKVRSIWVGWLVHKGTSLQHVCNRCGLVDVHRVL